MPILERAQLRLGQRRIQPSRQRPLNARERPRSPHGIGTRRIRDAPAVGGSAQAAPRWMTRVVFHIEALRTERRGPGGGSQFLAPDTSAFVKQAAP